MMPLQHIDTTCRYIYEDARDMPRHAYYATDFRYVNCCLRPCCAIDAFSLHYAARCCLRLFTRLLIRRRAVAAFAAAFDAAARRHTIRAPLLMPLLRAAAERHAIAAGS